MLLARVQERSVSKDKLERVYNELPIDDKDEFIMLIKDNDISAVVIAEVVIEDGLSRYAVEMGVRNLARRIQAFRRGESSFARKHGVENV